MKLFGLISILLFGFALVASAEPNAEPDAEPDAELVGQQFEDWRRQFIITHWDLGATAIAAMKKVEFIPRVIELDRRQPEFTLTLDEYLRRVVNASRVAKGRRLLAENRTLLRQIGDKYKVQPRFIVALWGIETNFGQHDGGFSVPSALASLAFDGRRSKYFTKELIYALKIIADGHIAADKMNGSWAGAMGQVQFMPSTFSNYAVDFDGDDKADLWGSKSDALASAANYLSSIGWRDDLTWGREVKIPHSLGDGTGNGGGEEELLKHWQAAGVSNLNGSPLPSRNLKARLLLPKKGGGRAFLVYANFNKILNWNRSNYFAIAVGKLSDAIKY